MKHSRKEHACSVFRGAVQPLLRVDQGSSIDLSALGGDEALRTVFLPEQQVFAQLSAWKRRPQRRCARIHPTHAHRKTTRWNEISEESKESGLKRCT